ncbi:MAG: hypothetical protein QXR87_04260 [Candidatus Hadarchaeales archaeon]
MEDIKKLFLRLFLWRGDVYAVQREDGAYILVRKPLTPEILSRHLEGLETIGVYQVGNGKVKWICYDLDGDDLGEVRKCTLALLDTLRREGVPEEAVRVEFSGRRGYHVWIFLTPTALRQAYVLARRFASKTEVPVKGKVGVEIFPKQASVPEGGYGNLVKLPLGVHRLTGQRSAFVSPPEFKELDPQQALSGVKPWTPPPIPEEEMKRVTKPLLVADFPCWVKLSSGEIPEGYRHYAALFLASHLRDKGVAREAAEVVLREWWKRVPQPPKTSTPYPWEDAARALEDTYKKGYRIGCRQVASRFPDLCSPSCPLKTGKRVPLRALEEAEATERVELAGGRWVLECAGSYTRLYDPFTMVGISKRGRYPGWREEEWESFLETVKRLGDQGLKEEIARLREEVRKKRMEEEAPLVREDSPIPPHLEGLHSIMVYVSPTQIRVEGETYTAREELKKLLDWDPKEKCWKGPYSPQRLGRVLAVVRKHDRVRDPRALGLERCWACGRWVERERLREGVCCLSPA